MNIRLIYLFVVAVVGWFAIIMQFYLVMGAWIAQGQSLAEAIVQFFSYFTILTNMLVSAAATALLLPRTTRLRIYFDRPPTLTAIAVYISVVGLGYTFLLRHLWHPQGLQRVTDELLHTAIPALYMVYWLLFVRKRELNYRHLWPWLIYPLVYAVYALARGAVSGLYPYPFIDVQVLGMSQVLTNSVMLAVVFVFLAVLYISIGKLARIKSDP